MFLLKISETDAAATSEATINPTSTTDALPVIGTIVSVKAYKVSGDGATIDPICGRVSGGGAGTNDAIYSNGVAAASIDSQPGSTFALDTGQSIYWKSQVNAGTNNVIATEVLIAEGYENT